MQTEPIAEVAPGCVFRFDALESERPLAWAALLAHPDESDWLYVVPADEQLLIGSTDLPIIAAAGEPLVLRCGLGIWLSREQLRAGRVVHAIESDDLARARTALARVTQPDLSSSPEEHATDMSHEYEQLLDELEAAGARLKRALC